MKIPATKPVNFSLTLHYGKINMGAIHRKSPAWRVPEPQNLKTPDSSALRDTAHYLWFNSPTILPPSLAPLA